MKNAAMKGRSSLAGARGGTDRRGRTAQSGASGRMPLGRILLGGMTLGCLLLIGCGSFGGETDGASGTGVSESENAGTGLSGTHGTDASKTGGAGTEERAENGASGEGEFFQIQSETETLFEDDESTQLICMQFYQGEPVQFRCRAYRNENDELTGDIYLYREDGSSELLVAGVVDVNRIQRGKGFLAQDGSFYYLKSKKLAKWDSDGRAVYEKEPDTDLNFEDICQLSDGTIVVLAQTTNGVVRAMLMKLDADTGNMAEIKNVLLSGGGFAGTYKGIAAGDQGLLLMERIGGIYEIDLTSGSMTNVMSFQNATVEVSNEYSDQGRTMHDFRMLEGGDAQILWAKEGAGICETLRLTEADKTVVVIRDYSLTEPWLREQIAEFNRTNQDYQVIMDTAAEGVEWEDYARQTSVEIAAGKGPDLLYGEVLGDYRQGIILQGGFADLRPYMERDGLTEEEYFPTAFCSYGMGESVYGISVEIEARQWMIRGELLEGKETPDIRTLVDALIAWPEEGCFLSCDEEEILRSFLEGSDSLWGMIHWERGTCDFSGDLFGKMLEAAKRYADTEGKESPSVAWITYLSDFRYFCGAQVHKEMGYTEAGTLFDDGCYAKKQFRDGSLAVNANSSNIEGAWEFIRFLLGEERQMALARKGNTPVSRTAFEKALQLRLKEMEERGTVGIGTVTFSNGQLSYNDDWVTYKAQDVKEEWKDKYRQTMEEVRTVPLRTEPILEIICQEAEEYFKGVKDTGQVAEIIGNKVQVYLDENL